MLVLLAVAHLVWGSMNIDGEIAALGAVAGASLEGAFLQVGATMMVGGVALVAQGIRRDSSNVVPLLVLAIYAVNFVIGLLLVIVKYALLLDQIAPQLFMYFTLFVLLLLGIKANRNKNEQTYLM
jgi:uncharacterized membrane protein